MAQISERSVNKFEVMESSGKNERSMKRMEKRRLGEGEMKKAPS
jgi:hypothetical protein